MLSMKKSAEPHAVRALLALLVLGCAAAPSSPSGQHATWNLACADVGVAEWEAVATAGECNVTNVVSWAWFVSYNGSAVSCPYDAKKSAARAAAGAESTGAALCAAVGPAMAGEVEAAWNATCDVRNSGLGTSTVWLSGAC